MVDDEEGIREIYESEFTHQGFQVHTAANVDEALKIAANQAFEVVISDVRMPGKTGIELLEFFRKSPPVLNQRPLIFLMSG